MTNRQQNTSVTMWQAIRDVVLHALDRGQILPVGFFAIIFLIVYKVPNDQIGELFVKIASLFHWMAWLGWLLSIGTAVGWKIHVQWYTRVSQQEIDRVVEERNRAQEIVNQGRIASSRKPKAS